MAVNQRQNADGTLSFINEADTKPVLVLGGPAAPTVASPRFDTMRIAVVPLANAADTGGAILSWQNPLSVSIIIDRLELDLQTIATGACTADFGTTASDGTTSSDNLIDGVDLHSATGVFDNITDKGSNGKSKQKLAAGKWLTGSTASGAAAGLAGYAHIFYHPVV